MENKIKTAPAHLIHPKPNMDAPPDNSSATDDTVDALLERYLALLDEYTSLRAELSRLQAATFQHLARANFAAERGARYGADSYDERMQAVRTVVVSSSDSSSEVQDGTTPTFQVVMGPREDHMPPAEEEPSRAAEAPLPTSPKDASRQGEETEGKAAREEEKEEKEQEEEEGEQARQQRRANDPLRWFGVLTPLALRQTQACAVDAVERVVPRLATVDAAMRALEIEVRRARKRRAKAAARRDVPPEHAHVGPEAVAAS